MSEISLERDAESKDDPLKQLDKAIVALRQFQNAIEHLQQDYDDVRFAAHMPDDYEFGLPSWINQHLYACYIGASVSPHLTKMIENGTLTFPNAPASLHVSALATDALNKTAKYRELYLHHLETLDPQDYNMQLIAREEMMDAIDTLVKATKKP